MNFQLKRDDENVPCKFVEGSGDPTIDPLWICYNGTSTPEVCCEDNIQDAYDTFADEGSFDTQGPLSVEDVAEMWEEFPNEGPDAYGYFSAGNAGEFFNGSYLSVRQVYGTLYLSETQ